MTTISLRDVQPDDLDAFFAHQQDAEALRMAAFTSEDPADREAFDAHWGRIQANPRVTIRTVLADGEVAGHVASFDRGDQREVTYWIGREHWGRGVATQALRGFLGCDPIRPLFARAAADNAGSIRVLEKCGFAQVAQERGFAHARGEEIDEVVLELSEP